MVHNFKTGLCWQELSNITIDNHIGVTKLPEARSSQRSTPSPWQRLSSAWLLRAHMHSAFGIKVWQNIQLNYNFTTMSIHICTMATAGFKLLSRGLLPTAVCAIICWRGHELYWVHPLDLLTGVHLGDVKEVRYNAIIPYLNGKISVIGRCVPEEEEVDLALITDSLSMASHNAAVFTLGLVCWSLIWSHF